jgi:hypothetical protein
MVGATAIDLTAFVRSRILNLFVGFVRFVVKHPVSGRRAIGPITLVVGDWSRPCDREGDRERKGDGPEKGTQAHSLGRDDVPIWQQPCSGAGGQQRRPVRVLTLR